MNRKCSFLIIKEFLQTLIIYIKNITVLDCNIIEIEGTRTTNDTKNNFLIIEPLIVGELLTKNGKN